MTNLSEIQSYLVSMAVITIFVGLNFLWLYSTIIRFIARKKIFLVISIVFMGICFFTYNFLVFTNSEFPEIIGSGMFLLGLSSFLALFSLYFFSAQTVRNTHRWTAVFILHLMGAMGAYLYFFIN